jgi:hypothetical protein
MARRRWAPQTRQPGTSLRCLVTSPASAPAHPGAATARSVRSSRWMGGWIRGGSSSHAPALCTRGAWATDGAPAASKGVGHRRRVASHIRIWLMGVGGAPRAAAAATAAAVRTAIRVHLAEQHAVGDEGVIVDVLVRDGAGAVLLQPLRDRPPLVSVAIARHLPPIGKSQSESPHR